MKGALAGNLHHLMTAVEEIIPTRVSACAVLPLLVEK